MRLKRAVLFTSLIGWSLSALGTFTNQIAVFFNNVGMPVKSAACLKDPKAMDDATHTCMTAATHLKFLCDYIHVMDTIYSPGDLMLFLGLAMFTIVGPIAIYLYLRDW